VLYCARVRKDENDSIKYENEVCEGIFFFKNFFWFFFFLAGGRVPRVL
jgi:hypothetical protein